MTETKAKTETKAASPASAVPRQKLVLICGLAGSGHSTALHYLADAGYSAIDNLPLFLFDQLIAREIETHHRQFAVSVDVRTSGFTTEALLGLVADIRRRLDGGVILIFLTASPPELLRRYNATRRQHPLLLDGKNKTDSLAEAIAQDGSRLASVEAIADSVIDTSGLTPTALRHALLTAIGSPQSRPLPVLVSSFSYRFGVPEAADMLFDMRFLQNPHWQGDLADKSGRDKAVGDFITADPAFAPFIAGVMALLAVALPLYQKQGRPQCRLAFGCTGGRHRSVFAAEYIASQLAGDYDVRLTHHHLHGG